MVDLGIRRLRSSEEAEIRGDKSKWRDLNMSGPLSLVGRSDLAIVQYYFASDRYRTIPIDLGSGDYMYEGSGLGPVDVIQRARINWSLKEPISYFTSAARSEGIPYLSDHSNNVTFFQAKYESAVIRSLAHVDRALYDRERRRSLLGRCFGPLTATKMSSDEGEAILVQVREILREGN